MKTNNQYQRILVLIGILLSILPKARSQSFTNSNQTTLTISDGLTHNGTTSVLKDSHGYVWIGTFDGLNRYDGYEFKCYKNTSNQTFFQSNRVRSLFEDSKKNIWINTEEGISLYDYNNEEFKEIYSNNNQSRATYGPTIKATVELKNNNEIACASTENGLLFFDHNYKLKESIPLSTGNRKSIPLKHLSQFNDSILLVSTDCCGVFSFNRITNTFKPLINVELLESYAFCHVIAENKIVVNQEKGLAIYDLKFLNGELTATLDRTIYNQFTFASALIHNQEIWLGTVYNGLIKVEIQNLLSSKNTIPKYRLVSKEIFITSIINFDQNTIMGGTKNRGAFRVNKVGNPFKLVKRHSIFKNNRETQNTNIYQVCPLDSTQFLFVIEKGIPRVFNTWTKRFSKPQFSLTKSQTEKVQQCLVDSSGNIWFHIYNEGIAVAKKGKGQAVPIEILNRDIFPAAPIWSMAEARNGEIWIGSAKGIFILYDINIENNTCRFKYLSIDPKLKQHNLFSIKKIYPDPFHKNRMWIGTQKRGLFCIDSKGNPKTREYTVRNWRKSVESTNTISSDNITSIISIAKDELFVGTEQGGLCRMTVTDNSATFKRYLEEDGLTNHVVRNIHSDYKKNLWIATNVGLNKFNPKTERFQQFSLEDGIRFEAFREKSAQLSNGYIAFSGHLGIVYFSPSHLKAQNFNPPLEINNLKVRDIEITPHVKLESREVLTSRLNNTDKIELKYDENVFSIDVTLLHYGNNKRNFIEYKIEPINNQWIKTESSKKTIRFNGLQPGKYTLKCRASNSSKIFESTKELAIVVTPPWWQTTLFFVCLLTGIGVFLFYAVRYILRYQKIKYNLTIEQIKSDNIEKINQEKLGYFTNISHEIKTPLTLIAGPLEILTKHTKVDKSTRDNLDIIARQTKQIQNLVNQVHDFQRADTNKLRLNNEVINFDDFIHSRILDYEFMARRSMKKIEVKGEKEALFIHADQDKLEKISNNLLSNAFKFTKRGDKITVQYRKENQSLIIEVSDTGKGISEEDLPHIFEQFYQSKGKGSEYTGGSGIGLAFTKHLVELHKGTITAKSKVDVGTTIIVTIPVITTKRSNKSSVSKAQNVIKSQSSNKESKLNTPLLSKKSEQHTQLVYIVEDNVELNYFLQNTLSDHFKTKTFANGADCLKEVEINEPDLIVSDVLMPELNGFDLCAKIKSNPKLNHIPIILVTACTSTKDKVTGLAKGADAYIGKPFEIDHLISQIKSLIKNRQVLKNRFQEKLSMEITENIEGSDKDFMKRLLDVINNNLKNPELDVDFLASACECNRNQFYNTVKKITNDTPYELLKEQRLLKAEKLLSEGGRSVIEVSDMVGFKSRTHFTKLFKEKFGKTPSLYKNNVEAQRK